jgi:mono/diheme cytochrome c family protein
MGRILALRVAGLGGVLAVALAVVSYLAFSQTPVLPLQGQSPLTAGALLTASIPDGTPNAAVLRRGQYLVAAGDCMSCHLRAGGEPFAGGLGLKTPFGVIYSANITSDRDTGIGAWNAEQFYHAMHDGIGSQGENLYPAFPYASFRRASRADDDAILAYLQTTPAVRYSPPQSDLRFPLNLRFMVKFWNLLYLNSRDWQNDPNESADWNRGAYLVEGFGHCSGCHTPKNWLGADEESHELEGARLDNWVAPDLTSNERTGLGAWSVADIAEYLANGRNAHAGAGGDMAEVVTYSTALMTDADRQAMAVFLKSRKSSPPVAHSPVDAGAMLRGAAIYSDVCASCHLADGVGQPRFFPPLGKNAMLQQVDPTGLEHIILAGARIGTSPSRPSPLSMPSFAWKLSDAQIADVATYLRNSWGNQASALTRDQVRTLRTALDLATVHLTANSGDRNDAED